MAQDDKTKSRADEMVAALATRPEQIQHDYDVIQLPRILDTPGARLINYKGCYLPELAAPSLKELEDFQFDESDVLICGFPKTGTTWMEEIVYQVLNEDDDPSDPNRRILKERCPLLENFVEGLPVLNERNPPRFMKSHLHYQAMPESFHETKPKVIYTIRNPKDNLISFYHYLRMTKFSFMQLGLYGGSGYEGTLQQIFSTYAEGKMVYGPFWQHVSGFWNQRNSGHVLCVAYEELQKDFTKEVSRIAKFLGVPLSESRLQQIRRGSSFSTMKQNKSTDHQWEPKFDYTKGHFFRKGTVGDWKSQLSEKQSREIEDLVAKELQPLGVNFCYEI